MYVVVVVVVFYFQTAYNNTSTMDSSLILISFTQFEAVARASGCGCALIYNKIYFSLVQIRRAQLAKAKLYIAYGP